MKTENELLIEFVKKRFPYLPERLLSDSEEFCNQYRNCISFKLFVFKNLFFNHLKSILWKKSHH